MKKVLWKDFYREIWKSKSRFISIFAIVFIGVAFFAGIKATAPDMKQSMDSYYDKYNFMDIHVMSTLGLTDDDISAIKKTPGVLDVQSGYFADVVTTIDATEYVIKVHSIPPKGKKESGPEVINQFKLTQGRYPSKSGECIMEDSEVLDLGLDIGDKIQVGSGKTESLKESLKVDEFTIVGKGITPYYLSYEKGASEIGSGKVNFFIMALEDDFTYPVYTEALVTVKGAKELNSYSKKYEKLVEKVAVQLDNIGVDRSALRLDEIKDIAQKKLDKAKKKFEKEKKRYEKEIKSGEEKLDNAHAKLVSGEATLAAERKNFEENYRQATNQIADAKKKLAAAEKDYDKALKEYNKTMSKYGGYLDQLNSLTKQANSQKSEAETQIKNLNEQLKDPNLTDTEREGIKNLISNYKTFLSLADGGLNSLNDINDLGQGQVSGAESQLGSARNELDSQSNQLTKAQNDLLYGRQNANSRFAAAESQLASGWISYGQAKNDFDKQKKDGQKKLDEGREKIIRAENEIEKLSKPQWYVLDRNSHYSFADYGKTADRIDAIAKIFPVFFFLVASLVCLTTMTRMVDEQRGIIGAYKALGYGNRDIAKKYVLYAIFASLLGGVSGLIVGLKVFPEVIYNAWSMMYTLPPFVHTLQIPLMIISVLIGVLVTTLSAWAACSKELKETPALLLRPKAPKLGKKILLERIEPIWKRLSFSHKVTARNIFRYKKRFFMTVIGITGCAALLLAGFGLSDSIGQVVNKQYNEIITHDVSMKFTADSKKNEQLKVEEELAETNNVRAFTMGSEFNAKVNNKGDEIAATLIVPSDEYDFNKFITLRERGSKKAIEIPEKGVVINEKLAKELKVSIGDAIEMDNGDGAIKKVEVADITENYVFHYVYMSPEAYKEVYRLEAGINNVMIKLNDTSPAAERKLGSDLMSNEAVASVVFYSAAKATIEDTVTIMNSIVVVIILSAGLLAFVVLYNLTNINISERIREIATIKVLGFYNREVASYVFRENILLSLIGAIAGLFVGIGLHRAIMLAIEQDGVMFGYHIDWLSFIYAVLVTMVFVMIVNIFMYFRLKHIPMVESLKSVE